MRNDRLLRRTDMLGYFVNPKSGATPSEAQIETAILRSLRKRGLTPYAAGTVTPYVSEGRWVSTCTDCNSGMALTPGLDRMTCIECGAYYVVEWPDESDVKEIEQTLLKRKWRNRNMQPGETIAQLKAQNKAAGIK